MTTKVIVRIILGISAAGVLTAYAYEVVDGTACSILVAICLTCMIMEPIDYQWLYKKSRK